MHLHPVSDQELIHEFLKGKPSSLQILIERHQQRVFASLILLVKDRQLAEDLFQDTFVKVINSLREGKYNEEGKFLPWVLRIAHNLAIDYFRKNKQMPMVHDREDFSIMESLKLTDDNIEDRIIRSRIHHEVRILLDELPMEQREVVIMRHYGEMSFKEIADVTQVSLNTALGRMRYALINLRKLMKKKNLSLSVI